VAIAVREEANRPVEGERLAEQALARPEGEGGGVMAVQVDDVEQVEIDRDPGPPGALRVGDLHSALQAGEAGDVAAESGDLARHDEVAGVPRAHAAARAE